MRKYLFFYCIISISLFAEICEENYPDKIPLFGDLHVHTALSLDAATQGTINRPEDAYRYGKGESISIQPYKDGIGQRTSKLSQPLDFMSVTDHAELLGEVNICESPELDGYSNLVCLGYRYFPKLAYFYMNGMASLAKPISFCGDDRKNCKEATRTPWQEIIRSAEKHNAPCKFTTFIGYEWTGAKYSGNNLHRNIIFENSSVPELPVSFYDATSREELWNKLDSECTKDCDYVVIPHNSNLSNGLMFEDPNAEDYQRIADREPLIEIFQHKGASECLDEDDPYCDFELLEYTDFAAKFTGGDKEIPKESFARYGLNRGLELKNDTANPFRFGFIASTDTHLAIPGATDEVSMPGHGGAGKSLSKKLPKGLPDDIEFNPGGLAVVWATNNSRKNIFQSLKSKEAYATSGPRYIIRFFGGEEIHEDSCKLENAISSAYQNGVPMGGTLNKINSKPSFLISALADQSDDNQYISSIQIIKSSYGDQTLQSEVIEVLDLSDSYQLDETSCMVSGVKKKNYCSVWEDKNFKEDEDAYYYLRVISAPTCRWSHELCNQNPDFCEDHSQFPKSIQERAWTSPIWIDQN